MALIKHCDDRRRKTTLAAAPVTGEIRLVQQFPGKLIPSLLALKNPE